MKRHGVSNDLQKRNFPEFGCLFTEKWIKRKDLWWVYALEINYMRKAAKILTKYLENKCKRKWIWCAALWCWITGRAFVYAVGILYNWVWSTTEVIRSNFSTLDWFLKPRRVFYCKIWFMCFALSTVIAWPTRLAWERSRGNYQLMVSHLNLRGDKHWNQLLPEHVLYCTCSQICPQSF